MKNSAPLLALLLSALALSGWQPVLQAQSPASEQPTVDFNRDIRPILSDRCIYCHGPDEASNDSGLRLDLADEATAELPSGDGFAIVPGDPEASQIVARIETDDESMLMPPVESHLKVTDEERQLLRRWIKEGAAYQNHWAFEPLPESIPVPQVGKDWGNNSIDAFVYEKLLRAGLSPATESERWRWLRRVTFDLTGLPPTPEEVAAFTDDKSEDAYEKVVDRLLDSARFGQHMAVSWLDAARYADSYGYQSDKLNTQWPYRDWVIRMFNQNLPYDEFLTWQLAGDLLETPTREQRLATAFNRIHRLNNEGGAVFEEWRVENICDRVQTFGTAVLGLTMECARCHDHKYDPISQRDFFSLFAFFNSIDENGLYDRTAKVPSPTMLLPTKEQSVQLEQAFQMVQQAKQSVEAAYKSISDLDVQSQSAIDATEVCAEFPDRILSLNFDEPWNDKDKPVFHPSTQDRGWTTPLNHVSVTECSVPPVSPIESQRRAAEFDGERGYTTSGIEPFDRWAPFTVAITLREQTRVKHRAVLAHHTRGTDAGYNGWDLTLIDGHLESRLYRVWPGNAIGVRTTSAIPVDKWQHVSATYDGSSQASGLRLFLDGKELETQVLRDHLTKSANVKVDHGGQFVIGQRFRDRGFAFGLIDQIEIYSRDLLPAELVHLSTGSSVSTTKQLYAAQSDPVYRAAKELLLQARRKWVMAEEVMDEIPIMKELDEPLQAHVLARGQYDAPTDDSTRVGRDTFEKIGPGFPEGAPRDRVGLARWVTDPSNPLTARVAVNRIWANFFGNGLVGTPENFGLQGDLPTNPALLDWVSRDFIDHGWDMKRLCKQLVLSATYRQSSVASAKTMEQDPQNTLIARGPAHRLSAEQIRDLALWSSNLLNEEVGGPPVSPYQAGGDLWRESNGMSPPYKQSVGRSLYRRSIYSVWKRTAPLPNMMAFDAPTREVCSVRRSRTNTPLQALVLLNDVQFIEACRKLAEHVVRLYPDGDTSAASSSDVLSQRINMIFQSFTGRSPDSLETKVLGEVFQEELKHYQENPAQAKELLQAGDASLESVDADDPLLAALTIVCQSVLNLDATIWKR